MKLQFTTKSMLLATAFVGIWLGGMLPLLKNLNEDVWRVIWEVYYLGSAIWIPFAFAIYAIGRRSLSWKIVLAFALAEAGAVTVFVSWWMRSTLEGP